MVSVLSYLVSSRLASLLVVCIPFGPSARLYHISHGLLTSPPFLFFSVVLPTSRVRLALSSAGPERVRLLADPLHRGDPAVPALVAVPIVRLRNDEPSGRDLCAPEFVASAAGAYAGEVDDVVVGGGRSVPRFVVSVALFRVENDNIGVFRMPPITDL